MLAPAPATLALKMFPSKIFRILQAWGLWGAACFGSCRDHAFALWARMGFTIKGLSRRVSVCPPGLPIGGHTRRNQVCNPKRRAPPSHTRPILQRHGSRHPYGFIATETPKASSCPKNFLISPVLFRVDSELIEEVFCAASGDRPASHGGRSVKFY